MSENKQLVHKSSSPLVRVIREVVFGMEDGMVSTLGALTGIAVGSGDQFVIVLSGLVIVSVESISMGVGSYISNISEWDINRRRIYQEKEEIKNNLRKEKIELKQIFIADGWPESLAREMSKVASTNKKLMLRELAYRELNVSLDEKIMPLQRAVAMFFSYIIGGLVPLFAYFIWPLPLALYISVAVALVGLFALGVMMSRYSGANWAKTGARVFLLGSAALVAGYFIGELANLFLR